MGLKPRLFAALKNCTANCHLGRLRDEGLVQKMHTIYFLKSLDKNKIDFIEQIKILLLNRAIRGLTFIRLLRQAFVHISGEGYLSFADEGAGLYPLSTQHYLCGPKAYVCHPQRLLKKDSLTFYGWTEKNGAEYF